MTVGERRWGKLVEASNGGTSLQMQRSAGGRLLAIYSHYLLHDGDPAHRPKIPPHQRLAEEID